MLLPPQILHLLGRQHFVASHAQLRDHLSSRQLNRANDIGIFIAELPKVKRLAGSPESVASRVMALSLYAGERGFVSGMTSARQLGVECVPKAYFEVMLADTRTPKLPNWVRATRTSWRLTSDRLEMADGRILSKPLRTLLRCGATCGDVAFEKIAEQMWHRRLITPNEAAEYLASVRCQGRHGVARFERWLDAAVERPLPAQSGLEIDLATALDGMNLPTPLRQFPLTLLDGITIHLDLAWPDVRLGIEPGANWWHGGNDKGRKDRERDRRCDEVGWQVIRFDEIELRDLMRCARQVLDVYERRSRLQEFAVKSAP